MGNHNEENAYRILPLKLAHLLFSAGLFYVTWLLFRFGRLTGLDTYGFRYNYFVAIGYIVLLYWFGKTYNAYFLGYMRIRTLISGQFLSQLFSLAIVYFFVSLAWDNFKAPWVFFPMLFIQGCIDIAWSYFATYVYFKLNHSKKTLLVYRNKLDRMRFGTIKGKPIQRLYKITDELQYDGPYEGLKDKLEGYDAIFVAGLDSRCRNGVLKYCKENSVPGFFLPHVGDTIMKEAVHIQSFDSPVLYINRKSLDPGYAFAKRAFDMICSGIALILFSPIMLIVGLAIHFYDGGPAFYKQVRLTKDAREFKILKFRSMRVDAEKDGVARLSSGENDDRITPVGRFIRKIRLDELPQLWNIFVGDMSIVGPRPERPEIAEQYYKKMPDFKLRLQVRAGLTGYAQVYGKYNTEPYEKLEFDLLYINNMSVLTDLKLCFATLSILFTPESTAGVAAGQTTAMEQDIVVNHEEEYKM